jgi:hypothetical protein
MHFVKLVKGKEKRYNFFVVKQKGKILRRRKRFQKEKIQIDQSGKVEQTNKITIVAFSNGKSGSVKLRAKDKRYLQSIYQQAEKPKMFSLQVFAALLYLLLEKFKIQSTMVIIDKEYPGHETLIKSYIMQLVRKRGKLKLPTDYIRFELVGKSSNAHGVASKAFKNNRADFTVDTEDVLAHILLYEK